MNFYQVIDFEKKKDFQVRNSNIKSAKLFTYATCAINSITLNATTDPLLIAEMSVCWSCVRAKWAMAVSHLKKVLKKLFFRC